MFEVASVIVVVVQTAIASVGGLRDVAGAFAFASFVVVVVVVVAVGSVVAVGLVVCSIRIDCNFDFGAGELGVEVVELGVEIEVGSGS